MRPHIRSFLFLLPGLINFGLMEVTFAESEQRTIVGYVLEATGEIEPILRPGSIIKSEDTVTVNDGGSLLLYHVVCL